MAYSSLDTLWVLLAASLVFFMQAGFAMVETGLTRAKNAGNIIMKNMMDFVIGSLIFWIFGFGIMFGESSGFIGTIDLFTQGNYNFGIPTFAFFIFQTVFCATAATIVSGAMAERTKFISYCVYSGVISLIIYPVSGHWVWGGGWLSELGFHDFAGSTVVHMVGGVAALVGAAVLGPRIGKYDKNGKPKAIPGHSLTLAALGVFILWFGWFGFNGGSTIGVEGQAAELAGKIFVTTNLSAAAAAFVAMTITWVRYKKPDVSMTLNGALAGLVAITAGCDTVSPASAVIIGLIAGAFVVFGIEFIEKVLKIDDPVGAIGVHGISGSLGTLMVGLFSDGSGTDEAGLLFGGSARTLGIQALGVLSVVAWVFATAFIMFKLIKHTIGLRASKEEELIGLDRTEHGLASSYADFMLLPGANGSDSVSGDIDERTVDTIPVEVVTMPGAPSNLKFTQVTILCRQNKFEELKSAMNKIGVTGLTVTQVLGCGTQKGSPEYYRGVPVDFELMPKIRVDIVVCKVPVRTVIESAKKALYTGHIGDGKIFVYNVENVIRVRTGEEGFDALQDSDET